MSAKPLTEADVLEALRVCFDPELAVNIVDLGLVYAIRVERDINAPGFEPRYAVLVTMTMRTPSEDREAMLMGQVRNRLAGTREISRADVELVWEPHWTADRMTLAARQQLGLDRPSNRGLVSIRL